MMAAWPKSIGFERALDLLRLPNHRLMKMATTHSPDGAGHFIVPGGYVSPEIADKLKKHPQIKSSEDGLFPGHSQTWKLDASQNS